MPSDQIKTIGENITALMSSALPGYFRSIDILRFLQDLPDYNSEIYSTGKMSDAEIISEYRELLQQVYLVVLFTWSLMDGTPVADFLLKYPHYAENFSLAHKVIKTKARLSTSLDIILFLNPMQAFYQQQLITRYIDQKVLTQELQNIFEAIIEGYVCSPDNDKLDTFLNETKPLIEKIKEITSKIDKYVLVNSIELVDKTKSLVNVAIRFYEDYVNDPSLRYHVNLDFFFDDAREKVRKTSDKNLNNVVSQLFFNLRLGLLYVYRLYQNKYPSEFDKLEPEEKIPVESFVHLKNSDDEGYLTQKEIIDCFYLQQDTAKEFEDVDRMVEEGDEKEAEKEILLTFHDLKHQYDGINHIIMCCHAKTSIYKDDESNITAAEQKLKKEKELRENGIPNLEALLALRDANVPAPEISPTSRKRALDKEAYEEQVKRSRQKYMLLAARKDEFYSHYNLVKKRSNNIKLLKTITDIRTKFNAEFINPVNDLTTIDRFLETAFFSDDAQKRLNSFEAELDSLFPKAEHFIEAIARTSVSLAEEKTPTPIATTPNSGNRKKKIKSVERQLSAITLHRSVSAGAVVLVEEKKEEPTPPVSAATPKSKLEKRLARERELELKRLEAPLVTLDLVIKTNAEIEIVYHDPETKKRLYPVVPVLTKREKKAIKLARLEEEKQQQEKEKLKLEAEQLDKIFSSKEFKYEDIVLAEKRYDTARVVMQAMKGISPDEQSKLLQERIRFFETNRDDKAVSELEDKDSTLLPPLRNAITALSLFKPVSLNCATNITKSSHFIFDEEFLVLPTAKL